MKKKILITVGVITFIISFFLLFYTEIKAFFLFITITFGYPGLFGLVTVMDTMIQPISPDILIFGATFSGSNLITAALIGGSASCLGGTLGYLIGKKVGSKRFKKWFGEEKYKKGHELIEKYGVWAVIVGAFSPIPYSSVCWTSGIFKMNFSKFIIASILTRIPRFSAMALLGLML